MANKQTKLQVISEENRILTLTLAGKSKYEIAEELGLNPQTVDAHLKRALEEAKEQFVNDAERLLVRSFLRTEMLIDSLMQKALDGDMGAIDRVDKLINTQSRMIQRSQPLRLQIEGNPNKPVEVFHHGSDDYMLALEIAKAEPQLIIDPVYRFEKIAEGEGLEFKAEDTYFYEKVHLEGEFDDGLTETET